MAKNGSTSIITKRDYEIRLEWSITTYSVEDLSTTINWRLMLYNNNGAITDTTQKNYTVKINDVTYTGKNNLSILATAQSKLLAGGNTTINHNADGTRAFYYSFTQQWALSDDNTASYSSTGLSALDTIPGAIEVKGASDFNDEGNPSIVYGGSKNVSLVSKLEVGLSFDGVTFISKKGVTVYDANNAAISSAGMSYKWELQLSEREALRRAMDVISKPIRYYAITTYTNGHIEQRYTTATVTLINYTPTLSPTVIDINNKTVALTGDNNKLVRYYSIAQYNTGAAARKEATITSQYVTSGGVTISNKASGTIENVTSNTFNFGVTDSRGYSATSAKVFNEAGGQFIPYVKLTASLSAKPLDTNGTLNFTIDGRYYNGSFGATSNSLKVSYELRKNGQSVGIVQLDTKTQGNISYSNDSYVYSYDITGLEVDDGGSYNTYSIIATVEDALLKITTQEIYSSRMPIFDWSKDDFRFNVPVHFERGFTNDIGMKTAEFSLVVDLNGASNFSLLSLSDFGVSDDNTIYNLTGTIAPESSGRVYPLPIPALTLGVGDTPRYSIAEAARLWLDDSLVVHLTTGAAWGLSRISVLVMYF